MIVEGLVKYELAARRGGSLPAVRSTLPTSSAVTSGVVIQEVLEGSPVGGRHAIELLK